MHRGALPLAAIVLAAGAGSRYSAEPGAKLLANLDGRPVLAHVLAVLRSVDLVATIVVIGYGADGLEAGIDWGGERRVRNPHPERGLASSLRMGIDALRSLPTTVDGCFIVLGDQPRLRAPVMRALAEAAAAEGVDGRPLIVPSYEKAGPRNPVLLLRSGWGWVDQSVGDAGLAAIIEAHPAAVRRVPVAGAMPDIDTPEDLRRVSRPPAGVRQPPPA